jgi:hypothetical protein
VPYNKKTVGFRPRFAIDLRISSFHEQSSSIKFKVTKGEGHGLEIDHFLIILINYFSVNIIVGCDIKTNNKMLVKEFFFTGKTRS